MKDRHQMKGIRSAEKREKNIERRKVQNEEKNNVPRDRREGIIPMKEY